jgi:cyanophycinase
VSDSRDVRSAALTLLVLLSLALAAGSAPAQDGGKRKRGGPVPPPPDAPTTPPGKRAPATPPAPKPTPPKPPQPPLAEPAELPREPGKPPRPPQALVHYMTGEPADAERAPSGPGLVLMGGGPDVNEAFQWMRGVIDGGDVVVLRTSGSDGYNLYLFEEIGGCDSVETLMVTTRQLANSEYVAWRVATAEAVFIAGGDQATYVAAWKGTRLSDALGVAWRRGAVLGGTSAGAAVLGRFVFGAKEGGVRSPAVLVDPFAPAVALERDLFRVSFLDECLVDSHVGQRQRRGRLVTFLARLMQDGWSEHPLGIGLDESTALVIERGGKGTVHGRGKVTLFRPTRAPKVCAPGLPLELDGISAWTLSAGDTVLLPAGVASVASRAVHASGGVLHE